MNNGRMKFVAGDDLQFSPRTFAQKFFYRESEIDALGNEIENQEAFYNDSVLQIRDGKMIFKQGAEDEELLEEKTFEDETKSLQQRPQRPPRPPQGQNPAQLSREIYNQMLILNELYQDLTSFRTEFANEIQDMISELNIVTFAMGRIYQTLSRSNRLPIQTLRKPPIRDFCRGIVTTSNYLRGILYDLRLLERINTNSNIDAQLVIIMFTLQAQQSQLQEIRQDCIEGGLL